MDVTTSPEARLRQLGLALPTPPQPQGSYVPWRRVGDLLYTSGVLPRDAEGLRWGGVVGDGGLTVAEGQEAARLCALNLLALVDAAAGSLAAVAAVVQVVGFVRSRPGFSEQPQVLNGASELLVEVLGERGRHTRMALGTNELPQGAAVEISAVVQLTAQ